MVSLVVGVVGARGELEVEDGIRMRVVVERPDWACVVRWGRMVCVIVVLMRWVRVRVSWVGREGGEEGVSAGLLGEGVVVLVGSGG